jgi:TonB family protein
MELTAASAAPFDVSLKFFTRTHSYNLSLPAQSFAEKPLTASALFPFAARTQFALPDGDTILALSAGTPSENSQNAPACTPSSLVVWDSLPDAAPNAVSAIEREARKQLALSFADPPKVVAVAMRNTELEPRCVHPYRSARVVEKELAGYPEVARAQGATGRSTVMVALGTDGGVESTKVWRTSGSPALDEEAMRAAGASSYSPEIFRCEALRGSYLFVVDFTIGGR